MELESRGLSFKNHVTHRTKSWSKVVRGVFSFLTDFLDLPEYPPIGPDAEKQN